MIACVLQMNFRRIVFWRFDGCHGKKARKDPSICISLVFAASFHEIHQLVCASIFCTAKKFPSGILFAKRLEFVIERANRNFRRNLNAKNEDDRKRFHVGVSSRFFSIPRRVQSLPTAPSVPAKRRQWKIRTSKAP